MIRKTVLFVLWLCLSYGLKAQEPEAQEQESQEQEVVDSVGVLRPVDGKAVDTVRIKSYAARYDPRKAALYAAILPGLGQVYTKKYWKIPLVYGGFAAVGYGLNFYQNLYVDYKSQLFEILETGENSKNPLITESVLRPAIEQVRRERDFMIILMAGVYILQIVDAHVDAHLKEFDVNPNLQVKFQPSLKNDAVLGQMAGLSLTIKF